VTPLGIEVHLHVTHQILADLVAARRPAVSTALAQLEHAGLVTRVETGWLLAVEGRPGLDDVADAHLQHT
jgi:ribosomal protein S19E (S16A)